MKSMIERAADYYKKADVMGMEMPVDGEDSPVLSSSPDTAAGSTDRQQQIEKLYQAFCNANDYYPARSSFIDLCNGIEIESSDEPPSYEFFKKNLCGNTTKDFFSLLDRKASQAPYQDQPCKGKKVLIVGGGPCGLRAAIEICLLGGHPVVVEKRDYFSRYNVANLWDFVVKDLKSIGGRVLQKDLCVRHDRAAIKLIQLALFKISLLLGTTFHAPVEFQHILSPTSGHGWKASVLNTAQKQNFEIPFDFIIGADGKRNSLDFSRVKHPMTLAIGITCNFIYRGTKEELEVSSEAQGAVARIYRQAYFKILQDKGFDLENIVYFVDKTHYFIFTAKKECLLKQGVLKTEDGGEQGLLHPSNIDMAKLENFAFELVQHITEHKLPGLSFAKNHHGEKDISIFDFTNFYQAEQACRVVTTDYGSQLLQQIVGDTLIEPFWPIGSGMALGFLSVFDAVWAIRKWCLGAPMEEVVQQRKEVFAQMTKINQSSLKKHGQNFTIDPETRYSLRPNSMLSTLMLPQRPKVDVSTQVSKMFDKMSMTSLMNFDRSHKQAGEATGGPKSNASIKLSKTSKTSDTTPSVTSTDEHTDKPQPVSSILSWFQEKLAPLKDRVEVKNVDSDWYNGIAFCALIHLYRPDLISLKQLNKLDPSKTKQNKTLAFDYLSKEFGLMTPEDILSYSEPKRILPEYLYDLCIKLRQLDAQKYGRKGPPKKRRPKTMVNIPSQTLESTEVLTRAHSTEDLSTIAPPEPEPEQGAEQSTQHRSYQSIFLKQGQKHVPVSWITTKTKDTNRIRIKRNERNARTQEWNNWNNSNAAEGKNSVGTVDSDGDTGKVSDETVKISDERTDKVSNMSEALQRGDTLPKLTKLPSLEDKLINKNLAENTEEDSKLFDISLIKPQKKKSKKHSDKSIVKTGEEDEKNKDVITSPSKEDGHKTDVITSPSKEDGHMTDVITRPSKEDGHKTDLITSPNEESENNAEIIVGPNEEDGQNITTCKLHENEAQENHTKGTDSCKKKSAEARKLVERLEEKVTELEQAEEKMFHKFMEIRRQKKHLIDQKAKILAQTRIAKLQDEHRRLQESLGTSSILPQEYENLADEELQTLLHETQEVLRELSIYEYESFA